MKTPPKRAQRKLKPKTRQAVVVLEDDQVRIDYLRSLLITYDVFADRNVAAFLALVEEHRANLALVVFDHDLGCGPPGWQDDPVYSGAGTPIFIYDDEGLTGADAARTIVPVPVPALVWSQSIDGSRTIAHVLHVREAATKIRRERFERTVDYGNMVLTLINGYESKQKS